MSSRDNKFAVIPADALFDERITPAMLRCLGLVCYYGAQKSTGSWPSYETLSADMGGTDRRNVMRYIKKLCEFGYVEKTPRRRADGSQTSNTYRVTYDVEVPEIAGGKKDHPVGGSHDSLAGGKKDHPVGGSHDSLAGGKKDHPALGNSNHPNEQENLTGKKNNKKTTKMTLTAWEKNTGSELCVQQMMTWVKENNLDADKVAMLIVEFREMMHANGTPYADFTAAFKNYVRRGFLTIKMPGLVALPDKSRARTADYEVQL